MDAMLLLVTPPDVTVPRVSSGFPREVALWVGTYRRAMVCVHRTLAED